VAKLCHAKFHHSTKESIKSSQSVSEMAHTSRHQQIEIQAGIGKLKPGTQQKVKMPPSVSSTDASIPVVNRNPEAYHQLHIAMALTC
jgi:hypothetical protein